MAPLKGLRRGLPISVLDGLSLTVPDDVPADLPPSDLPHGHAVSRVLARQDEGEDIIIPAEYGALNSSLEPGAIAGIVLGSVAGFLLLVWLLYLCANAGRPPAPVDYRSDYGASRVTVARSARSGRSRNRHHHHHHHRHHSRHTSAGPRGVRMSSRGGPVIVEPAAGVPMRERTRSVSRAAAPPRVVPQDDEDEVVVIEDRTPPRRSRRYSRYDDPRRSSRDY